MIVFHGTNTRLRDSIRREGLRLGTGVTPRRSFAADHGDLIVSAEVDPAALRIDPAYPPGVAYWLLTIVPSGRLKLSV